MYLQACICLLATNLLFDCGLWETSSDMKILARPYASSVCQSPDKVSLSPK